MSNWTQPICCDCWDKMYPDKKTTERHRNHDSGTVDTCCMCGHRTVTGIYIRIDPKSVMFPQ